MADGYEFTREEIKLAFEQVDGKCECCGKRLYWGSTHQNKGPGQWHAHHGSRYAPVILCTGNPENCHLNCGHDGAYHNPGITPRVHKGGGYVRG